jgi:large subunit ribosomal protein L21
MKAVIEVGNKQYIVAKGDKIDVDLLPEGAKKLDLEPLMVFDDKDVKVGAPVVKGAKVEAKVVEGRVLGEKLRVIRFKSKKRVKKISGHRQKYTTVEISSIA